MSSPHLSTKAQRQMILRALLAPVMMVLLLFLAAGRWDYWQAWVYTGINMVLLLLMRILLTKDAGLVEERLNPRQGMKATRTFRPRANSP